MAGKTAYYNCKQEDDLIQKCMQSMHVDVKDGASMKDGNGKGSMSEKVPAPFRNTPLNTSIIKKHNMKIAIKLNTGFWIILN